MSMNEISFKYLKTPTCKLNMKKQDGQTDRQVCIINGVRTNMIYIFTISGVRYKTNNHDDKINFHHNSHQKLYLRDFFLPQNWLIILSELLYKELKNFVSINVLIFRIKPLLRTVQLDSNEEPI